MNDPFDLVCIWLKSALDCENFVWDVSQHIAATECLEEAQKELQRRKLSQSAIIQSTP